MQYAVYSPSAPLKKFVHSIWMIIDGDTGRRERILPSGAAELVINLSQDEICTYDASEPGQVCRRSGAVVAGTYSRAFIADTRQHLSLLGVHFHPGGAFPLLGTPAIELSGAHTNLEDVWGAPARLLRQQLCDAITTPERFQLMEQALLDRARRVSSGDSAVDAALRLFGPIGTGSSTSAVARELGLSQRQFIHLFARQVGLTPKLLCRVLRFQYARILAQSQSSEQRAIGWAQIAIACGYYDQAHLIRDFKNLSGVTPSQYIRQIRPVPDLKEKRLSLPRTTVGKMQEFLAARDLRDHDLPR
ncbi:MAG TPA: AraC family transcriptional regulator [Bryobacteraceae bacterium]|nr:AraC family transcriptional regulator [Bryobacteraceae bacterium]